MTVLESEIDVGHNSEDSLMMLAVAHVPLPVGPATGWWLRAALFPKRHDFMFFHFTEIKRNSSSMRLV
jgi:hypothetical protein